MALLVETETPQELLDAINEAIDQDLVRTWAYDEDGDFTHTAEQWQNRAWMAPEVLDNELRLCIFGSNVTVRVYAVYHGRFAEMLLAHFDTMFTNITLTAQPDFDDTIGETAATE